MDELIKKYPTFVFSRLIKDKARCDDVPTDLDITSNEYTPITLNKENIPQLLKSKNRGLNSIMMKD